MAEHRVGSVVGRIAGVALAPLTGTASALRRARTFHPRGIVLAAQVRACTDHAPWSVLAERLEGPALVRLSGALWKRHEWTDVLGCAIRFTHGPMLDAQPRFGDQDLLFATIRRPWTMAFAPLTTEQHDYFANRYYAVSPFHTDEAGVIEWRLRPERRMPGPASREERVKQALAMGKARFTLEARRYRRVIDVGGDHPFHPVARVELLEVLDVDQDALRFDPFRAGRGIRPVGAIQGLRAAAYRASQWARPRGTSPHADDSSARLHRPDGRARRLRGDGLRRGEPTRVGRRRRRAPRLRTRGVRAHRRDAGVLRR